MYRKMYNISCGTKCEDGILHTLYSAKVELCDHCYLSVSVSRINHERIYGFRPNMVGMGKG